MSKLYQSVILRDKFPFDYSYPENEYSIYKNLFLVIF